MINFKKGPALSLHQVNYIGKAKSGEGIVAGMVVNVDGSGDVVKADGADSASDKAKIYGFAINSQDAGDVIESGAIGVYALDGASVIETDQAEGPITLTHYPIGSLVGAKDDSSGFVAPVSTSYAGKVIGQVEGIRTIPGVSAVVNGVKVQGTVTVLGIKLLS